MKALRVTTLLVAGLALFVALGFALPVAFADSSPAGAAYVDSQSHVVPGSGSVWYRFDYVAGAVNETHPDTTLKLINGKNSGVSFEVYTFSQIGDWWDKAPVGQGTPNGDDLLWKGNFDLDGTYYVRVLNDNAYDSTFQLMIAGDGVKAAPVATTAPVVAPVTKPATTAVATPAVVTKPVTPTVPTNVDPYHAVALSVMEQGIAADSELWYTFKFDTGTDAMATVSLPNGYLNNLKFEVYTPDQVGKWWDVVPVGQGTKMGDNDLEWSGALGTSGTFYVRVINDNANGVGFDLDYARTLKQ